MKAKNERPSLPVSRMVLLLILGLIAAFAVEAKDARPPSEAARKSNRNYANACELLSRKRMAKGKVRSSKRKMPKWR